MLFLVINYYFKNKKKINISIIIFIENYNFNNLKNSKVSEKNMQIFIKVPIFPFHDSQLIDTRRDKKIAELRTRCHSSFRGFINN